MSKSLSTGEGFRERLFMVGLVDVKPPLSPPVGEEMEEMVKERNTQLFAQIDKSKLEDIKPV